ncbi:AraC family transcriptional regulator [Paenibacillus sp. KQZ6P-2]|uniref:AraC family transcriptional regulator n=1 Tax=Paenibacillus mangrovi TaxID=2931978 RepID=A0A9X1WNS7_9BACL|nr:AraC family transcriptional regulator [Paenibacillus mangrovi]MCJ8010445.1 AraC family transcriptional regulator [Paenibacillus mangrovi]
MFKQLVLKNPFQLFLTISLPFLLSVVVLLFVQSSILKQNFEDFALQMIYNQQKTELQNTSRNVQSMADSVRSLAITAFFDDKIKDLLYSDVAAEDYVKYQTKIESYKNIYPFLQSIYIYNGQTIYSVPSESFVYNRATFADKGIFQILDDIKNNRSHSIVLRKIPNVMSGISTGAPSEINVYSYLFFDTQLQNGKVDEALILNISEDWIKRSISTSHQLNDNRMFILDSNGRMMSRDPNHPLLSDMNGSEYTRIINSSKGMSGSMRMDADGVDSFITYTDTGVFGWKLVSVTPYTKIVQEIESMKKKTYLLMLIFLTLSMLIMFYFSRRLYVPVKLVIQNYRSLEMEKKDEFYNRKQECLRKLVQTNDFGSAHFLHSAFHKYRIAIDPAGSFLLLLLKIDHFSEFCSKYRSRDRGLLKFGMMNIVSELLSGVYNHECIEVEDDQILVWINFNEREEPPGQEQLFALVQEIQQKVSKYLSLSVSVTISEPFETISNLNFHYLKLLDLSYYRMILGHQAIITESSISNRNEDFKYPQDKEKELTDALIQGRFQEADRLLMGMIGHASSYSYTVLNSVLIRLLLSIRYALELLEANHSIKVNFNFHSYLNKLQTIETLDKIKSDFHELFEHLAQELESKKDLKYKNLLEDVSRIIQRDFANPALSLDTVAGEVGFSSSYLGKLFKKHLLISVNDYINQVRLTHATELIATTNETILDVMQQSGFSSRSHFFTLFKKEHGLTPVQYRNLVKKSG